MTKSRPEKTGRLRRNFQRIRGNLAFVVGLLIAAGMAGALDRQNTQQVVEAFELDRGSIALAPHATLSDDEYEMARFAWRYFERNTDATTGLVLAVENFPSTTIWDQGSALLAHIAARRLSLIDQEDYDLRVSKILNSLAIIPLFEDALPNKVYNTSNRAMTDYANNSIAGGIGWSALDIARMTVPLYILATTDATHSVAARKVLQRFDYSAMLEDGVLLGARVSAQSGKVEYVQEGRLGYEEYGARAIGLLGLDALNAAKLHDYLDLVEVSGQEIAIDSRSVTQFQAHNYVLSEPYLMTAFEFGLDTEARVLAERIFRAQQNRFSETGQLTAVSEDHINQAPYFLYNTVYVNGKPWQPISEDGRVYDQLRTVSTKAAIGWHMLYDTEYTEALREHVLPSLDEERGWRSGVFEADGSINDVASANTNALILEALHYRQFGPLISSIYQSIGD